MDQPGHAEARVPDAASTKTITVIRTAARVMSIAIQGSCRRPIYAVALVWCKSHMRGNSQGSSESPSVPSWRLVHVA